MDVLDGIASGFGVAFQLQYIGFAFLGVFVGTLAGCLPGIGPTAAMAALLPLTFSVDATGAIIMFAGIYYGAMYGNSIASILLKIPGEAASVMTALEGYEMTRRGRGGAALTVNAVASFIGGTVSVVGLMLLAPALARFALHFGPPEYAVIALFAFVLLSRLASGRTIEGVAMVAAGVLIGTVGVDPVMGRIRFDFGTSQLVEGIGFIPLAVGVFGVGAFLVSAEHARDMHSLRAQRIPMRELMPNRDEMRRSVGPIGRGGALGFLVGLIPGPSAVIATVMSRSMEMRVAKGRDEFGRGAVEGVAGPEAANNSSVVSTFIPLLALGLPFAAPAAIILAALTIHGITPGPQLMVDEPLLFWGVIASMYVGNLLLLVLNLPAVRIFTLLLELPQSLLFGIMSLVAAVGVFAVNNSVFDVWVMIAAGLVGWGCQRIGLDLVPLLIGLVLGPIFEEALRQSMIMSSGSFMIFLDRIPSLVILLITVLVLVGPLAMRGIRAGMRSR